MTREQDIANQLTLPDSVKENVNETMKAINKSINSFNEIYDSPTIISDDNNEPQDIYMEDDYLNDEVDFVGERNQPTDSVEITSINDTWTVNEEPKDVEFNRVNLLHPQERLKRKLQQQEDDHDKIKIQRLDVEDVRPIHPRLRRKNKIRKVDDIQITGTRPH